MSRFWKIIFSISVALLFSLVFAGLVDRWAFPDTSWDLSGNGEKVEIKPGYPVMQKFEAGRNNLSRIRILFGKSYNKDGGIISLKLTDENCKNILSEESFERSSIQSEGYYDFNFSRISDSKNNSFCLVIDFEPEKEKYKKLNVFVSDNLVSGGQLRNGKEEIENRSLEMRPAYRGDSFWENVEELNQRISQYKPEFLKGNYLYFISFLFIVLSVFLLFLMILI